MDEDQTLSYMQHAICQMRMIGSQYTWECQNDQGIKLVNIITCSDTDFAFIKNFIARLCCMAPV